MRPTTPVSRLWLLQSLWGLWWWCAVIGLSSSTVHTPTKYHPQPATSRRHIKLLSWVVEITYDPWRDSPRQTEQIADSIAHDLGLVNAGRIGSLQGVYQLDHVLHNQHFYSHVLLTPKDEDNTTCSGCIPQLPDHWKVVEMDSVQWRMHFENVQHGLESHCQVTWFTQLHAFRRRKRSLQFDDPAFPKQWHLVNTRHIGHDLNIMRVWERNITGLGVVAAVVDDGLEWTNPDIRPNYFAEASYDLNNYDRDPMPSSRDKKNHHGTRCAGEIAAAANSACAVGVAYDAGIAGLKVLDGPMTDGLEGVAFTKGKDLIDVYSCSWGPDDDGKTVDGPHYIALKALREAVDYGRKGYGSVFVVASGNGGMVGDNCNFDGYANSIYTVTIGAVDEIGAMPYYAEECASMLAVTYSSGSGKLRSIVTTDWRVAGGTGCTEHHTGTSAAAPLAAGMIALMLQARPCLTWRDVQHIIVMAAVKVDIDVAHWTRNKAGFHHSHKHGFGLMDAWRLVNAAKLWHPVPWMTLYSTEEMVENTPIPAYNKKLELTYTVDASMLLGFNLLTLEYVHVIVTLEHAHRGSLEIRLACPSHTESVLAATRSIDDSADGFTQWTFSTVRCWGETPEGDWVLIVQDKGLNVLKSRGVFKKCQLKLYGSAMSPADVAKRRKSVHKSASGEKLYDNFSLPCPPPPLRNKPATVISQKNLKILVLAMAFCLVMAVYETLEYIFCYDDEKKKHAEELQAATQSRAAIRNGEVSGEQATQVSANPEIGDVGEGTRLLTHDEIQMDMIVPTGAGIEPAAGSVRANGSVLEGAGVDNTRTVPVESPSRYDVKDGFAGKVKHIMSRFYRHGSRINNHHQYLPLSESDRTPLTGDDASDDVVFDVCDTNGLVMDSVIADDISDGARPYGANSRLDFSVIREGKDEESMPFIRNHANARSTGEYVTTHDINVPQEGTIGNGPLALVSGEMMSPV